MPLLAASSVLSAFDTESSRPLRSLARLLSDDAVKKFVGLSSAELTFLPVARRVCVVAIRSEVCCRASRFERTAAERRISAMTNDPYPFWITDGTTASDRVALVWQQ